MIPSIEHLLRSTPSSSMVAATEGDGADLLDRWLARLLECPLTTPIDRAFWAGFEADRLGFAFVGGYHAALACLLGDARWTTRRSLAATEKAGAHPRAIETTLTADGDDAYVLNGEKTFATLASVANEILVIASTGAGEDGKNRLRLVLVPRDAKGLTVEDRPPTPFAPEIPHARIRLEGVRVRAADVLPGDGYDLYLKPFRTLEDSHVSACTIGHLIRTARLFDFERSVIESLTVYAITVRTIALSMDPRAATTHVALSGVFRDLRKLIADHDDEWKKTNDTTRERWRRDIGLLLVAEQVRQKRTEAAWSLLRGGR